MKKKLKFLGLLGILPFFAVGQLTNNGATIVIESGATLVVEGTIDNNGIITNSGTINVTGDLDNTSGTLTSDASTAEIIFSGTGVQNFTADGDIAIEDLVISNTGGSVNLLSNDATVRSFTVETLLDFEATAQKLNIGPNNLNLLAGASIDRTGSTGYVQADGSGQLLKTFSALGNFVFPVGDDTNFSPIDVDVTAGTVGSSTIGVNLVNAVHASLPTDPNNDNRNATEYLTRYWNINETGMGVTFAADVSATYDDTDDKVLGTGAAESLIIGAKYDGAEWNYADGTNTGTDGITSKINGSVALTGSNAFGTGMFSVFLGGAYDETTNLMRTDLNGGSSGILATLQPSSPYGTGESVAASFFDTHTDIVDWIKIEVRNNSNNTDILNSRSAFLRNDGTILDIDGTAVDAVMLFKDVPETAYVSIKHRNHHGIMFNSLSDLFDGTAIIDFTSSTGTFGTSAQQLFDGSYMLWAGDVNDDNYIRAKQGSIGFPPVIIPSERDLILNTGLGGNVNGQIANTYSVYDTNMDGYVRAKQGSVGFPPVIIPSDRDFLFNFTLLGQVNDQKDEQLPEN